MAVEVEVENKGWMLPNILPRMAVNHCDKNVNMTLMQNFGASFYFYVNINSSFTLF